MVLSRRGFLGVVGSVGSIALTGCNSSTDTPSIEMPASGLRDEQIPVEITGLEPGMRVTLRSLTRAVVEPNGRPVPPSRPDQVAQ